MFTIEKYRWRSCDLLISFATIALLLCPSSVRAQYSDDMNAFKSMKDNKIPTAMRLHDFAKHTDLLAMAATDPSTPEATAKDAKSVPGVNTAGTVRTNTLANIEALLNFIANGLQILGIAWGGPMIVLGFIKMAYMPAVFDPSQNKWVPGKDALKRVAMGACGVLGGMATPACINWLVSSSRDACLFS